jgi:diguanylate cyclase (GGDEF)-like protein
MINREQEQARIIAESIGPNGSAGRDLAWIVSASVLAILILYVSGAAEAIADPLTEPNMEAIVALLVVVPIGAIVFGWRRYLDAARVRVALEQLSYRDSLTGLPNRRFLGEGLDELMGEVNRIGGQLAVLFIDLNGFKRINDTYGHEVGDQLMVGIADRLLEAVGENDAVIRYGGDEFVAFTPDATNAQTLERLAKRIIRVIETPFERGDELLQISACVGIALSEERPKAPEDVLRDADSAMYVAKSDGPGSFAIFDRSMRDALTPSTAERRLRVALDNGEFKLYYQPIVSLWTRRLVGVEARLRWVNGEKGGIVRPEEFVPALEETGLIVPVGSWVIDEVCRQAHTWQEQYPDRPALNIKVNISSRQLLQTDFAEALDHSLQSSGVEADRICLEITENALLRDVSKAWGSLREAKALGVTLALDDFGTGFSSLSYLRRFSLDLLKIDHAFVQGLGRSREDETIVEHIIGMAKALGIVTVAEGVETEQQAEYLKSVNCDLAQGEYFAGPVAPHVIDLLLERGAGEHEWQPIDAEVVDEADVAVVEIPRFKQVAVTPVPEA